MPGTARPRCPGWLSHSGRGSRGAFRKDHPVDSSEAAFKTAGPGGFQKCFLQAHPVLLEPIVNLEVYCTQQINRRHSRDLNTKRARIENQDSLPGDLAVLWVKYAG